MLKTDRRLGRRMSFNAKHREENLGNEVHYVYALVDRETRMVGYFGVTNDPRSRAWQHKKDARRTDKRRSTWFQHNKNLPELVVLVAAQSRDVAEIVERCLIRNFNHAAGVLSNDYKYFNRRQERDQLVLDDIPFWTVNRDAEFVE